jgi:hypothetical protein
MPVACPVPLHVVASTRTTLGPAFSSTFVESMVRLSARISQPAPAPITSTKTINGTTKRNRHCGGAGGAGGVGDGGVGAWIEVRKAVSTAQLGIRRGGFGSSTLSSSAIKASPRDYQ